MKLVQTLALSVLGIATTSLSYGMSSTPEVPSQPHASGYSGDVASLAQGCFSIQSPATGNYLNRFDQGGTVDDGLSYHFENIPVAEAAQFFIKPTGPDGFLLTDKDGRYLASHLPAAVSAGTYAGEFAEWKIEKDSDNNFSFKNTALLMKLGHKTNKGSLYFQSFLDLLSLNSETAYRLVVQNNCTAFPEVTTNVSGNVDGLKGNVNEPVRGFVDAHAHITSYEFMGGRFMAGKPFHRWGVEEALKDSENVHGKDGALDLIGNIYTFDDITTRYDTRGWPDFPWWPNHKQMSHMGYYYKWIERAYLSGLRIMVSNLVENEVLCAAQRTINPEGWSSANSCNVMDSVRLQAQRLHEMQDYIDAQAGGEGKGFFRLANTAAEARAIIADGKMAVIMGIEASETFNCGLNDYCTRETIEAQLQEIYALGVRTLYPTHKFDNQLAGSAVEDGFINLGQWLSSGRFFETKECDEYTQGQYFKSGFPLIGQIEGIKQLLETLHLNPEYDEHIEHCNSHGLTELGVYLVNRMIDMNMLIEMDHMSNDTAAAVMDIVEARNYSGVITSHSWMRSAKGGAVHDNTRRLIEAGGFSSPYSVDANNLTGRIDKYLDIVKQTPYLQGVGLGTDMSGLGGQPGPRSDADMNPLEYPFVSEFGLTFDKQISGNRVFDFNTDGVAHYGMVADHLEDVREQAPERIYETIMNSAEAYLQMWERAERAGVTEHYNPL